jgi:hypothetical protein
MVRRSAAQLLHGPYMSTETWCTDSLCTGWCCGVQTVCVQHGVVVYRQSVYSVVFRTVQLVDFHRKDAAGAHPCICELCTVHGQHVVAQNSLTFPANRSKTQHSAMCELALRCSCSSGLTCRVLSEFGSSGLHHPAEAVRKVAERILTLVYRVNPRLVRKQLPPDDDITRRNLLYRQLFHEFDRIDIQVCLICLLPESR